MPEESLTDRTHRLIVKTLALDTSTLNGDAELSELSRDSIQLFELVLAFEREFNLQASYDDLIRIITVDDIINYLEKRLSLVPA